MVLQALGTIKIFPLHRFPAVVPKFLINSQVCSASGVILWAMLVGRSQSFCSAKVMDCWDG